MTKLEGIIYKTFENYIVLRGFAPIGDIAAISNKSQAYQRPNDRATKLNAPKYIYSLLLRIIRLSVESVSIINKLPKLTF